MVEKKKNSPGNSETTPISQDNIKKAGVNLCEFSGCKKKLKLSSYPCHCGLFFCPLHIPAEMHNCQFDYKDEQQKKLMKVLNKVDGEKVRKI